MKGIILAGGAGSRLYPMTQIITKQLQTIYDKPMIYYPLSLLMLCGIKEILLITTEQDQEHFKRLLGDGSRFGISLSYKVQNEPKGIAQAYTIAEDFLAESPSMMILGDNLFHGNFDNFRKVVTEHRDGNNSFKAQVFAYPVTDPERYGVVEFDKKTNEVLSIEEKPLKPKSNFAIPGLYILDKTAVERVKNQIPSERGELEITDLIKTYLDEKDLGVTLINRGMAWLDTGTPEALLEAGQYIATLEQRQGFKVACLEEVALRMKFINLNKLKSIIDQTPYSSYRKYLEMIAKEAQEKVQEEIK